MAVLKEYKNSRNQVIGWLDDKGTYHSKRDWEKSQIFHNPKYKSAIGMDVPVIKDLIKRNAKNITIKIKNFEKEEFTITTTLDNFIQNSTRIRFDKRNKEGQNTTGFGEQRIMPMHLWTRLYANQTTLPNVTKMIKEKTRGRRK